MRFSSRTAFAYFVFSTTLALLIAPIALGQGTGGGNNNNNNNNSFPVAGVEIDPQGVLRIVQSNPQVTQMQLQAARRSLDSNIARPSKLRKVSLNRLEKAVAEKAERGEKPTADMIAMAGITKLEYVFFYPDSGDIVLAGPAEGFGRDSVGRVVGIDSQRPCLLLDDVIVALRTFGPTSKKSSVISVSIDPTEAGLKRMQQALKQIGGSFQPNQVSMIVNTLQQALGKNDVTITGVPGGTHFAHVLTEADYRMKLIGIGLEKVPVPMQNYIDRLTANMTSNNALIRWYFVPDYEALAVSEDGFAMKLVGNGVKLIGEDEKVDSSGNRKATGRAANPASRGYTAEFTKKFNQIAAANPVYAQLRNLVDLSIVSAYIQDRDLYAKSGWDLGIFANEEKLPVAVFQPPKQVDTAINATMVGSRLVTPIGGGVQIQAKNALKSENIKADKDGSVAQVRSAVTLENIAATQWWWD